MTSHRSPLVFLLLAGCASASPAPAPSVAVHFAAKVAAPPESKRAYVGGTILPAPDAPAIPDGVLVVEGDRILAVGSRSEVTVPEGATVIDCHGATVAAAFWNAHVHFLEPRWENAASAPAKGLEEGLQAMLSRWGFAHAFDLGSRFADTSAIRRRVEGGEVRGPAIETAGSVYVAEGGQPIYVKFKLPELKTPEQARAAITAELDRGSDAIKLMTASVVAHPPPPVMPVPVIRAATDVAHARGALVFAHPTNRAGVLAARDGGVDILAHTAPGGGPWSDEDARSLVAAGMSLIPTISLWRREIEPLSKEVATRYEDDALEQVRVFAAAGGTLLFGTDVGYRREYDTTPEHELLARAGLPFAARLAMLTTAPAARFHAGKPTMTGRLAPGMDADVVVLEGDPRQDARAFANVRCTVRRGETIYAASPGACGI